MDKIFVNFLPPWVETNIQPAFYDKESGSVLQQTARMYAKVNCLVRMFNKLSKETKETVEDYIARFVALKDFVDTYFENLDVQEEINNKLDAMVEDGTLQTLLANYLVICGGNAKELGCAGDGVTDDTTAINTAITNLQTTGIYKLVFPEGEYAISGEIIIPSNFTIECMDGAVLKYVGEGKTGNIFKAIGTSNLVPVENITLKNINIDGSEQGYKGGASDATPLVTSTAPKYKGLVAMYFKWAKNVKIVGCNLNDIYGDGIKFSHCCNVKIVDNYLKDCSGGNIRSGGDSGYDNFGDGIVAFSCWDTLIDGNTIINTRVYQASATASDIGKQCGRSGVEFEYGLHQDGYDAPDTDLFQSSDGIGLLATNNFIYGYTKGGHFETDVKFRFDNNTVINCHIGAMMSIDGNSSASNNYFNDNGVGPAPQSGYDTYYCGIALSNYGSLINGKFVISGNVFDCTTSSGVGVAKDNVEIVDNQFYNGGIVTVANPANNTTVANNNFYEAHIFIYTTKGWQIIGNNFKCKTSNAIQIEGGENITISNNNINNSINIPSNSKDIYILGNHFESESDYTPINGNAFINLYQGSNIVFKDNIVNLKKNNTTKLFATSNINCIKFLDNSIKVDTTRSNSVVTISGTIKYINIEGNKLYGFNDYVAFIDHSYTITTSSIKENVTDNSTAYIYKQTTGGQWGRHCIEQNNGIVKFNGSPNDSTSKFVNTYMNLGERIYKFGTNTGWYVSRSGYYTTTNYANGTVTVGTYVISNTDYVYKCITGGTASVAPTGTTEGSTETGADGVKWLCCGKVATLTSL